MNLNQFLQFDALKEPLRMSCSKAIDVIVNPMDLIQIRANTNVYTSFDALVVDVQWMRHNCWILYSKLGAHGNAIFPSQAS